MAARKSADQWFAEYGASHQNRANKFIHWICVPVIFCSVLGFTWAIPAPAGWADAVPWFNWTLVVILLASAFYGWLSPALSAGMMFFMSLCYALLVGLDLWAPWPVWKICAVAFVVAWVGQFIGHQIEGRKPSFFHDVLLLLVGPAWLMSFIYRKLGQRY